MCVNKRGIVILYFPYDSVCFVLRSVNTEDGGQAQSSFGLRWLRITHKTSDVQLAVSSSESDLVSTNNMFWSKPRTLSQDSLEWWNHYALILQRWICFQHVSRLRLFLQPESDAVFCDANCIMSLELRDAKSHALLWSEDKGRRDRERKRQLALLWVKTTADCEHQKLLLYYSIT